MKNKRREYTAQFYKKNHIAFAAALLSSLLTSALNLYIAWVLQQMIDAVSGVPGSFALSALLWFVLSVIAAIILLKTASYFSKPCFMEKAMKQYKNYAFCKLTRKSISAFGAENTANYISAFSNDAATIENSYLDAQFNILFSLGHAARRSHHDDRIQSDDDRRCLPVLCSAHRRFLYHWQSHRKSRAKNIREKQ